MQFASYKIPLVNCCFK